MDRASRGNLESTQGVRGQARAGDFHSPESLHRWAPRMSYLRSLQPSGWQGTATLGKTPAMSSQCPPSYASSLALSMMWLLLGLKSEEHGGGEPCIEPHPQENQSHFPPTSVLHGSSARQSLLFREAQLVRSPKDKRSVGDTRNWIYL